MIVVNFVSYLIFTYLLVYSIYFLTLVVKSFSAKDFIQEQYELLSANTAKNKLCVVIWASDKNKNLFDLLDSLNNQTYEKDNYDVHVIYKNSGINKVPIPDFAHGARMHNIENPEFFGRDKAISTFIEKIIVENKYDAFIFLGADRIINNNYLEIINRKITPSSVIVGSLQIIENEDTPIKKLFANSLAAKTELTNNSINIARSMFELCQTIDGENCVISADIIEKAGRICFETRNNELKYSLFLTSNEIKPVYSPLVLTKIYARDFNPSVPSFKQAWTLFKYYLPFLNKKSWYFIEYLISIFRPTTLFILISYSLLFYFSFFLSTTIALKLVVHLGLFLIFIMILSIISSKISIRKIAYIILSPVPLFIIKFIRITRRLSKRSIKRQHEEDQNIDSATINSIVTNGKKDVSCKLDLVKEEGMRKVVFRYKKKRFESDAHLRMYDALENITKSLEDKGFILKVCQNCSYFTSYNDGEVDSLKGFCNAANPNAVKQPGKNFNAEEENAEENCILIWNCCRNFMPKKIKNILQDMNQQ